MDKVIIYRINWYETDTDILTRLDTFDNFVHEQQANTNYILTQLDTFVRKQQADTITATHTFDPTHPGPAFQLGPNAQNQLIRYLNADKVDGFDVSQTPAPNVIVPLNADGILDLSSTYIKSNVYTFRRVDLTDATSDYELKVGEEAIIRFNNQQIVSLHIATRSGTVYEMIISESGQPAYLYPNNTAYPNQFASYRLYAFVESGNWRFSADGSTNLNGSAFVMFSGLKRVLIINETGYKRLITQYTDASQYHHGISVSFWLNPSIQWTSLGTLDLDWRSTGFILIRRLL
jgi:hypothetical protein